jgi:putative Mg2+ transporter-C (MgtC) family protein
LAEQHVILDPTRVAAQVASGIGFIRASIIISRREIVYGLTTASSVWAVAVVGLAVSGGMFLTSVAATVLSLEILVLAKSVKTRLFPHCKPRFITLVIDQNTSLGDLRSEIEATNLQLDRIVVRPGPTPKGDKAELDLGKGSDEGDLLSLTEKLRRVSGVHEVNSLLDGQTHSRN